MQSALNQEQVSNSKTNSFPELLTIQQAAKLCGLGRNNLAHFIRMKLIPVVIFPGMKRVRIHQSDLLEFINQHRFIHR